MEKGKYNIDIIRSYQIENFEIAIDYQKLDEANLTLFGLFVSAIDQAVLKIIPSDIKYKSLLFFGFKNSYQRRY